MTDVDKTRDQLIRQLDGMRKRVAELECAASDLNWAKDIINAQSTIEEFLADSSEDASQADEVHKEREERFAKAFLQNSVPMAISTINEGRYVDVSDAFLTLMGLPRDEVIGNTSTGVGFITPEKRASVLGEFTKNGRVENLELQIRTKGGEIRCGLFNSTKIQIGQEDYLLTVVTDITKRKQAEEALRASEDLFRRMTNNLPGAVYQFFARPNGEMGLYYVSESAFDLLGIEGELKHFFPLFVDGVVPEDREPFLASIREAARTFCVWDHEIRFNRPDGKMLFIRGISQPRRYGDEIVFDGVLLDVTEQRQAERALRASENKYRRLHDTMRDAFVSVDMEGHILECNGAYLKMLGYEAEEIKKLTYFDLTPEKWHEHETAIVQNQILPNGYSDIYEKEYRRKDGTVFPVELRTTLIREDERPRGMWATVRDISARKKVEEALKQSTAYNRSLIEASLDPLVTIGQDGKITDVNTATEHVTGYARDELIGRDFSDYFTDSERARAGYQQVFKEGLVRDYELELKHRGGHVTSVLYTASVYRDASGQVAGVFAAARDISKRKSAEDALRESEAKHRFLTERINDIVWATDMEFNLTYMSPSVEKIMGYTPQERVGNKASSTMTQESAAKAFEMFFNEIKWMQETGSKTPRPLMIELEYFHKNGATVWMEVNGSLLVDAEGRIVGAQGVSRDITDRKWAERALRESEAKYRFLTEKMNDIVWTADMDFRLTYDSPSVEKILGFTPQERMQQRASEMLTPDSYAKIIEVLGKELERDKEEGVDPDRTIKLELEYYHKNGSTVWMECIVSAIRDKDGKPTGIYGVSRNITDRKRIEGELKRHKDQLEGLVKERTVELTQAYEQLKIENDARKSSETVLRAREEELEKGRRELEEMNAALKVLLKQREEDRQGMEMNIVSNLKTSVLPYLDKLDDSGLQENQIRILSMLRSLLGDIISPFIRNVSSEYLGLTPSEIQVASLIKEGKSSKDISKILNVSLNTIHTYRYKIRMKTGLKNNKVNLRSYLQTLG